MTTAPANKLRVVRDTKAVATPAEQPQKISPQGERE